VWFFSGIASPVEFDLLSPAAGLVECDFHRGFASAQNTIPSQAARVMEATMGTMMGTKNDPVMPAPPSEDTHHDGQAFERPDIRFAVNLLLRLRCSTCCQR